ncbi:hypothetical protein AX15_003452 [Amanita polypyramis BW_CC]|nr:hypothetical protein AX15_003452 [Amanita polypyramis BW_CC]
MQPREDVIRELQKYIASLDFGRDDLEQDHKDIYTYIEQTILPPESTILGAVPPVDVLAYAAKNILFPVLAQDLIPELLDVIATVEFYRQRTLTQAKNALEMKSHYKDEDEAKAIFLNSDEEAFLEHLNVLDDSWRKVYITILRECCHSDLYYLWTTNPPSMADFMIRFNEYFPFLNKYCTHPSPRLLHQTLSTDEQNQLGQTGLAICDLGYNSAQWVTENIREDEPYWTLFDTDEFRKAFPPHAPKHLTKLICRYLDHVASTVQKVDSILQGRRD